MNTKYLDWRPRRWFFNTFCHNFFSEWSSINYLAPATTSPRWKHSLELLRLLHESMKNYERFPRKQSKQCRCQFLNVKIFIPLNWTQAAAECKRSRNRSYERNMFNEIYVFVFHEINQLLITVSGDWSPTIFILLKQHPFTRLCWAQTNKLVCCPRSQRSLPASQAPFAFLLSRFHFAGS